VAIVSTNARRDALVLLFVVLGFLSLPWLATALELFEKAMFR
jgi:hypothetical protein